MKKRKQCFGTCVCCGRDGELTDDHIPPKNLFPKPRPNNLIRVPCCYSCNNTASKDDEYLRLNITSREDTPISPGAKEVYRTTMRGLERPDRPGLKNDLLSRTYVNAKYSDGGVYLGRVMKYDIDAQRMKVAKRIVKGLFYHELGRRLSDEYFAFAISPSEIVEASQDLHIVAGQLEEQSERPVGNGDVFTYRYRTLDKDSNVSQWLLVFYRRTAFFGFTVPNRPEYKCYSAPPVVFDS